MGSSSESTNEGMIAFCDISFSAGYGSLGCETNRYWVLRVMRVAVCVYYPASERQRMSLVVRVLCFMKMNNVRSIAINSDYAVVLVDACEEPQRSFKPSSPLQYDLQQSLNPNPNCIPNKLPIHSDSVMVGIAGRGVSYALAKISESRLGCS